MRTAAGGSLAPDTAMLSQSVGSTSSRSDDQAQPGGLAPISANDPRSGCRPRLYRRAKAAAVGRSCGDATAPYFPLTCSQRDTTAAVAVTRPARPRRMCSCGAAWCVSRSRPGTSCPRSCTLPSWASSMAVHCHECLNSMAGSQRSAVARSQLSPLSKWGRGVFVSWAGDFVS
jgi:hypothetical protein